MPFLQALLTIAQPLTPQEASGHIGKLLCLGEVIASAYRMPLRTIVFTTRRLVIVDSEGQSLSVLHFHTIPYENIVRFSVKTAGHYDLDAHLTIWLSGTSDPFTIVCDEASICDIQELLARYVLPTVAAQVSDSPARPQYGSSEGVSDGPRGFDADRLVGDSPVRYVRNLIAENKDWLYEKDEETVSREGRMILQYIASALKLGITSPKHRWDYACDLVERDLLNEVKASQDNVHEGVRSHRLSEASRQQQSRSVTE
jgi:hypothetical protein